MPPRRNRQQELDFTIHVDPSCANGPVEDNMSAAERRDDPLEYPAMDPWNEEVGDVASDESTPLVETDGEVEDELRAALHNEGDIDGEANSEVSHSRRESAFSMESHDIDRRESLREGDSYCSESARQSYGVDSLADEYPRSGQVYQQPSVADEGGDSSSHHENEDDVFSDNSPRSSMGSTSEGDQAKANDPVEQARSPRVSDFSQYEPDDFIPIKRETPRPAFRSPSSVRAMQMSSPPPSTMGSPRSSRRTPKQTLSRIGSPSVTAQYSSKKTPPRFKRNTPPLVLLHVTLLPLRWAWGDVLDHAQTSDLTEEGKTLREAWRHLQDRTGDTVSDRGILLPHPQNDFEVLEERLLEALELPVRRRARILECGHYLGPANQMNFEEEESEDEYDDETRSPRPSVQKTTHWCRTCEGDIRYDSLGPGKVFRVKVYASNGLMRAGAWDACWKEMERVDVEVEPLVDHRMLDELGHLAAEQERALEMQEAEDILAEAGGSPDERHDEHRQESSFAQESPQPQVLHSSPQPEIHLDSSPVHEDWRRREDERLREIYGQTPPTQPEATSTKPRVSDYDQQQETPPSPSAEAFERRETRRQADKTASLPELVLEALRVVLQDRKNVMIALLGVLILALAARSGPQQDPAFTVFDTPAVRESKETDSPGYTPWDAATEGAVDPCVPCSLALGEAQASVQEMQATVSIQTVTETVFETATTTATVAMHTSFEAEPVESVYEEAVDRDGAEMEDSPGAEDDAGDEGEDAKSEL